MRVAVEVRGRWRAWHTDFSSAKEVFFLSFFSEFIYFWSPWYMEFLGKGWDPSHSYHLAAAASGILNPLCPAGDQTFIPVIPRRWGSHCATVGTLKNLSVLIWFAYWHWGFDLIWCKGFVAKKRSVKTSGCPVCLQIASPDPISVSLLPALGPWKLIDIHGLSCPLASEDLRRDRRQESEAGVFSPLALSFQNSLSN